MGKALPFSPDQHETIVEVCSMMQQPLLCGHEFQNRRVKCSAFVAGHQTTESLMLQQPLLFGFRAPGIMPSQNCLVKSNGQHRSRGDFFIAVGTSESSASFGALGTRGSASCWSRDCGLRLGIAGCLGVMSS